MLRVKRLTNCNITVILSLSCFCLFGFGLFFVCFVLHIDIDAGSLWFTLSSSLNYLLLISGLGQLFYSFIHFLGSEKLSCGLAFM